MAVVNPYIMFNGNCEEALEFYKAAFGGEFVATMRMKDMDMGQPVPDELANKIMHMALPIGGSTVLMASDSMDGVEGCGQPYEKGNNFSVAIGADSRDEADKLFTSLSADGTNLMPMSMAPWGDYFGAFTDKFGIGWLINVLENPPQ